MTPLTTSAEPDASVSTPFLVALAAKPWVRLAAGAAAFVVASVGSSDDDGIVLCPFRRCTGGYCPGCGLTRSSGRLVRGDLVGAWHHHPFLVLGLAQVAVLAALWARGSRLWSIVERRITTLLLVNLAVLVALWLFRLALGDIPVPFTS